ncbi:pentapeptide repeat-containing protein [Amycolatopsis sp. cmx-4-68]|uniref:pentapeptide repeat-containing protein n=1 Tax=Amycolatopsis sp. cmx-4-68 TaxID=2790938 RepID=UPI003979002E
MQQEKSTEGTLDLRRVRLAHAQLRGISLVRADLCDAELTEASLAGADLRAALLRKATLIGADLSDAVLAGADLRDACFAKARLAAADLRGADLTGTDLTDATLTGADLRDTDLRGVHGLTAEQLTRALIDRAALPPHSPDRPEVRPARRRERAPHRRRRGA